MQKIISVILIIFIVGCQTTAQKQLSSIQDGLNNLKQEVNQCIQKVVSNPSFSEINNRYPIDIHANPTILQLSDGNYISDQETSKVVSAFNQITNCREIALKLTVDVLPGIIPNALEGFYAEDVLTSDLIQKKLTWGEYNKKRTTVRNDAYAKNRLVMAQVMQELSKSHQAEVLQRQRAIDALSDWAYKQQVLMQNQQLINSLNNSINRPVVTSCRQYGMSISCQSM